VDVSPTRILCIFDFFFSVSLVCVCVISKMFLRLIRFFFLVLHFLLLSMILVYNYVGFVELNFETRSKSFKVFFSIGEWKREKREERESEIECRFYFNFQFKCEFSGSRLEMVEKRRPG